MITHNIPQRLDDGTENPEWMKLRIGIPTASNFDKIVTPGGEPSKQWEAYAHKILAEEIVGHQIDTFVKSAAMEEGNNREAESVAYYELQRDVTTMAIGFVTDDARSMGCSPDRMIGDDGLLETKNPMAHTHVGYLIDGKLDKAYWPQLQGQLLVTGRKWVDIVSYFPEMPEFIIRVTRDGPYLEVLERELKTFNTKLQLKRQKLVNAGHLKGVKQTGTPPAAPKSDAMTVLVDSIVNGLKDLTKAQFNEYLKKRSEEISNVTLQADTENRARLAKAINDAKAAAEGNEQARNLRAG